MSKPRARVAIALLYAVSLTAFAQESARQPWEEYDKLIKTRESITALGPDLFGDNVDLASGALSFSATDVSIPGNGNLPVAFTRTFTVTNRKDYDVNDATLADWQLDTPRLSGVFAANWPDQRCSGWPIPPSVKSGDKSFRADEYWHGNHADIPGGGEMLQVNAEAPKPTTGGPYYWMTAGQTYFSCLTSIRNGSGEGFLAITQDGTKYWFDWMAQYAEPRLKSRSANGSLVYLPRRKNVLYATRVEDRFGNWVTYAYSNAWNAPARLTAINASDGRQLAFGYNAQGHIATVGNGQQTWTYGYSYPTSSTGTLSEVLLPDGSRWNIDFARLSQAKLRYFEPTASAAEAYRDCFNPGDIFDETPISGTITHPSGAVGEFTVAPQRHGRSNVPALCGNYSFPQNDPNDDVAFYPINWDVFSVTQKRISGPGLTAATWNYAYSSSISWTYPPSGGGAPICQDSAGCGQPTCTSDACAGTSKTTVTGPDNHWTRYTYGNSYRYNEGKLLKVETGSNATDILKTVTFSYNLAQSGQPYPTPIGTSPQWRGDGFTAEYLRPQVARVITQDGATFSSMVNQFDAFARPISVTKTSSLGYGRTEATSFRDNLSRWVLGQTAMETVDGKETLRIEYDANDLPWKTYRFGSSVPQQTLTYHADGTVATVADANNNITSLSDWKRGIPQIIRHPATPEAPSGATESAVVNDLGWMTSVTDENGHTVGYDYDALGRIASIVQPGNDTVAWNSKNSVFERVSADEHGLPANHWRQTVTQGGYRKITYFDALWRPVMEQEEDIGNPSGTMRWLMRGYDASGRLVFESYPRNPYVDGWVGFGAVVPGIRTGYDALDRVVRVAQDSELGTPLVTTTEYLSGFRRRTTNPRGAATIESFQAFDVPGYERPALIQAPEETTTVIERDAFGKPIIVTRTGG